jgi:hypothetical protein
MFQPLPGRTTLGVGPERIVAVIESINAPNIAIPEFGTEPTKAWLVGCLTPSGGACVFCYLLQTESLRPIVFLSNPADVPLASYSLLESESIQFVESMGFLLDNLNFRARPPQEQALLVETLPFFREPRPKVVVGAVVGASAIGAAVAPPALDGAAQTPARQALLRLLASY